MIKGVIFDVDGTLLDSMGIWVNAGRIYLEKLGIEVSSELSDILWEMTLNEAAVYLKKEYSLSFSVQEILEGIFDVVRDFYVNRAPLKEGAYELLQRLYSMNIPVTIATISDRSYLEPAFCRLDIMKYINHIFTGNEVGANKTEPDIYYAAASYMGLKPSEIMVFEDACYAARTAKKAGFQVTGIFDELEAKNKEEMKRFTDQYIYDFDEFVL